MTERQAPSVRAVLFDFGDTLFRRRGGHRAIIEAGGQLGVVVSDIDARRYWDEVQAAARTPEELAKGRDLSGPAHRAAWTELYRPTDVIAAGLAEALYEREIDPASWVPFPDTLWAVEQLRTAGIAMAVISDTGWDIRPIFERAGCLDAFGSFVMSYRHGVAKPAPVLFEAACADLGVAAEEALMVGDNPLTDGGAVGAGVSALVLPPVDDGAARGLWMALALAGVDPERW